MRLWRVKLAPAVIALVVVGLPVDRGQERDEIGVRSGPRALLGVRSETGAHPGESIVQLLHKLQGFFPEVSTPTVEFRPAWSTSTGMMLPQHAGTSEPMGRRSRYATATQ